MVAMTTLLTTRPHRPVPVVVTRPDAEKGRGRKVEASPVANLASELGLPTHKPARVNAPESVDVIRAADADFFVSWSLMSAGQVHFTMPRIAVLRGFVMSHLIHHRGQLSIYLRMNDVPVPSTYGPSADEGSM